MCAHFSSISLLRFPTLIPVACVSTSENLPWSYPYVCLLSRKEVLRGPEPRMKRGHAAEGHSSGPSSGGRGFHVTSGFLVLLLSGVSVLVISFRYLCPSKCHLMPILTRRHNSSSCRLRVHHSLLLPSLQNPTYYHQDIVAARRIKDNNRCTKGL